MTQFKDYSYLTLDRNRPVVFLDLCGVLNNYLSNHSPWAETAVQTRWLGHDHVDAYKADLLFALFRHYRVQVVMVSSWVGSHLDQRHSDIQRLIDFFDYPDVVGSVNTGGGVGRGESVVACVHQHQLTRWAVVDDANRLYNLSALGVGRLFSPHGRYGITDWLLESLEWQALSETPEEMFIHP